MAAVTGKENDETWDYLKKLGAKDILDRSTMSGDAKPLGRTNYAGAVDTVGGNVLANVISELKYGGSAAICGMAGQASWKKYILNQYNQDLQSTMDKDKLEGYGRIT